MTLLDWAAAITIGLMMLGVVGVIIWISAQEGPYS